MPTTPKSLFWSRVDTAGSEHALVDDAGRELTAHGVSLAVDPIPYTCRYRLVTGADGGTRGLDVEVEGAGWLRTVRLARAADRWRVTTAEQGDLDATLTAGGHPPAGLPGTDDPDRLAEAVDVDVSACPLFNVLPVRRLGLLDAAPGTTHRITVAWVLVPSLVVVPAEQVYTALGERRIRFSSEGFTAEIDLDEAGFVTRYPGLARRVALR